MFVDVNGHLLNTVSFGTGPRTLVAHGGWVGNWELWQQPFELLSDRCRCVSYDHRGSGESQVPIADITPQGLVDDLFGVMDQLGIDRCVLAGESLGAVVALQAAHRHPDRFEGLVLVDGPPGLVADSVQPLIDGALHDWPATVQRFIDDCIPEPDSEHIRKWGRDILLRSTGPAAAQMFSCYLEGPEPWVPLEEIQVPTLIIHGSADVIVPVGVGEWMASAIPGATFVRLEGAGHVPTMTRPQDVVNAIVDRFA
jgi:pimeloyl-ACP methyl ester carboxylesterase